MEKCILYVNYKHITFSELIEKIYCKDLNSFFEKLCNTFGNYKLVTRIFDLYYHRPKPLRCTPLLTRSQLAAYDPIVFIKHYPFL